ncbi:protein IQ-DOMAIN 1-like [Chenopodium quinoa]|uniref:protein IQ-DOMAIN 1-like n=1 Tax=Chenopodium quinoa TaxID=63459 RepID=UPI000B772FB5|nr:protein IQ-DOMAIN 1-like [Chenopodium quinoa]
MGKKGWFSAVKKALSPQSKKNQKSKTNKKITEESKSSEVVISSEQVAAPPPSVPPPPPLPSTGETKSNEIDDGNDQNKHAYSVAVATAAAAEAAVAAAQAAAEVVRLTTVPRFAGKSKEEIAAIKIQTAFRGYLARRALRALRGLVRLKSLIEGQSVKRQAATTLRCMQTLARVQSQIRARRMRMSEENQALQRQLQQKHEKELEKLRMDEIWDDSTQSKEQLEASIQSKQEATMRRERALAYAFTHQQLKKNNKNSNPTFMDPNNPQWGWSWLERWMAARPWEARSTTMDKETDQGSVKSFRTLSVAGEINRAYALRDLSVDKPSPTGQRSSRPPSRQSPSTTGRAPSSGPGSRKPRPESPKTNGWAPEDDTRSTMSIQSERYRRHSIAGSSVRDDESLASSPAVPSYMAPTKSAKAKTKLPSPLGVVESNGTPPDSKPPSVVGGSAKKRLSFPASPGPRRHSVPGKFESTPVIHTEIAVGNGESR